MQKAGVKSTSAKTVWLQAADARENPEEEIFRISHTPYYKTGSFIVFDITTAIAKNASENATIKKSYIPKAYSFVEINQVTQEREEGIRQRY